MANDVKKLLDYAGLSYYDGKLKTFISNTYVPLASKGQANGVVPLNASSLIDSQYLPSYVDDVIMYADLEHFPATGEEGKIYVAEDTGKLYRWVEPATEGGQGQYINISGTVSTADEALKLTPGRNINGTLFDGTEDITLPFATSSVAGTVIPGTNIDLDALTGTISVATATTAVKGVVQVGTNIDVASGVISEDWLCIRQGRTASWY